MNKILWVVSSLFLFLFFCGLGVFCAMEIFKFAYGQNSARECILYAIFFLMDMGYAIRALDIFRYFIKKK